MILINDTHFKFIGYYIEILKFEWKKNSCYFNMSDISSDVKLFNPSFLTNVPDLPNDFYS